jgi:hypothetical protein
MFPQVDTKNVLAVAAAARATFLRSHPEADTRVIDRLFADIEDIFQGRYLDYLPLDMRYHDFEHTLQAALCLLRLLDGRYRAKATPVLSAREFELAIASVLLHDTGYLKLRSDVEGTGAKYTLVHVIRSCAFAASYLPTVGFTAPEIDAVVIAIRCTGPRSNVLELRLADELGHLLGCTLATADYLGQMAAPDYVDELPFLFAEFEEADDFCHTPRDRRLFRSTHDLVAKTPGFWEKVVLPKITHDFGGVHRFLADPYPDGSNPYILAVEQNIARALMLVDAPKDPPASSSRFPGRRNSRSPGLPAC